MSKKNKEQSVLDLLSELKSGQLAADSLDAETRQSCVEYLATEGATNTEMAQLLGVSDRTIRRDREAIREVNALRIDEGFAEQIAGEFIAEARLSVSRIRRSLRDKEISASARIEGERAVIEILDRMIHRLQSLGFLPMATKHIRADLTHRLETDSPEDVLAEIRRLNALSTGSENSTLDQLHTEAKLLASRAHEGKGES